MANNKYTVMSEEAIRYICGLIRNLANVSEGINNTNLADDKVFSNLYTKKLIDKCLEDANTEAQKLVGALTHLTCEKTTVQPTLDNSQINVIYLYSADGNAPFQQYLKISETELIDMGETTISLTNYLTATQIASTYVKQIDFETLTTSFNNLVTSVDGKIDKDNLVTVLDDSVTDEQVPSAKVIQEELDKKIGKDNLVTVLDDSVTDEQVPSAKAVYDVWGEWSVISPIKEGYVTNSNGGGLSYYKQIKNMVIVTCSNVSRLIYNWNIGAKINEGGALPKPRIKIPVSIMSSNGEFYLAELDTDGYIKVKNREIPKTETGNIYYYSFNYMTDEL